MKKTIVLLALVGCSDEADIGVNSQPVNCAQVGGAEVIGTITRPEGTDAGALSFEFGAATPRVVQTTGGAGYTLDLVSSESSLSIGFRCGAAELARYAVVGQGTIDGEIECPFQVTGLLGGQQYRALAKSGTVVVDENSNCLAGRFSIDFGNGNELDGWFSSAWQ